MLGGARTTRLTIVAVLVCVLTLGVGYEMKDCIGDRVVSSLPTFCWSDAPFLYIERHLDEGQLPYIDAGYEYPVLTGWFMYAVSLPVDNKVDFYQLTALIMALVAIGITILLTRMVGARALLWAAAPALAFYAFLNWDVLVVAASLVGFWLWRREKPVGASIAFAIGACLKLYPALFIVPLVIEQWMLGNRKQAVKVAAAGTATGLLLNIPFMFINFFTWLSTFSWNTNRTPNGEAMWTDIQEAFNLSVPQVNLYSTLLTAVFIGLALWLARKHFKREHTYPFLSVCAVIVVTLLLWGKVHSPQYTLWLLPFFILLRMSIGWWVAYTAVDAWVYLALYGKMPWLLSPYVGGSNDFWVTSGVWLRAAVLLVLFVFIVRNFYPPFGEEGRDPGPQRRMVEA